MNTELKNNLKSFLDRLINASQDGTIHPELFEADADTLRAAITLEADNARLREELATAQTDAARYRWLREACGYVQDGSSTSVTISQDDATHEWVVRVGDVGSRHWWHGKSLGEAIDAAMNGANV